MTDAPQPPMPDFPPAVKQPAARQVWSRLAVTAAVGVVVGAATVGAVWWATAASDGPGAPSGPPFTASGKVTVYGSWVHGQDGEGCVGTDDFADLRGGTTVTVSDLDGHKLAEGTLESGVAGEVVGDSCTWPLVVSEIPGGAARYRLQVADRDPVVKAAGELRAGVALSYGKQE